MLFSTIKIFLEKQKTKTNNNNCVSAEIYVTMYSFFKTRSALGNSDT